MSRLVDWTRKKLRGRPSPPTSPNRIDELSNELLLGIFIHLDSTSLHQLATVSRRFYGLACSTLLAMHGGSSSENRKASCHSVSALHAIRVSLALPNSTKTSLHSLEFTDSETKTNVKTVQTLTAVLKSAAGADGLRSVSFRFASDILARPVGWRLGQAVPKLLQALCLGTSYAVIVVGDGIWPTEARALKLWSPHERETSSKMLLHDGSLQLVPTIRAMTTVEVRYPSCEAMPGSGKDWAVVLVDAKNITTLALTLKLKSAEWEAILADLALPSLKSVEVFSKSVTPEMVDEFMARHAVEELTFRVPHAAWSRSPVGAYFKLKTLKALAHYFEDLVRHHPDLPSLATVEVWSDDRFSYALRALADHEPLVALTFHSLSSSDITNLASTFGDAIFPGVHSLVFTNASIPLSRTAASSLSNLLAKSFPALTYLELDLAMAQPLNDMDVWAAASGSGWRMGFDGDGRVLEQTEFVALVKQSTSLESGSGKVVLKGPGAEAVANTTALYAGTVGVVYGGG
ncbi:F-box domain-containing protein [Mycena kentingensis (nom. inval.)]|nr:F-box domain-containing protein [Mycena kentingensis (nom. inval.)]